MVHRSTVMQNYKTSIAGRIGRSHFANICWPFCCLEKISSDILAAALIGTHCKNRRGLIRGGPCLTQRGYNAIFLEEGLSWHLGLENLL